MPDFSWKDALSLVQMFGGGFGGNAVDQATQFSQQNQADNRTNQTNYNNAALQREFAQMGVQWRAADSKAAGIHPLFGLGAQGAQASPSFIDGQDVSRAAHATRTPEERAFAVAQLFKLQADTDLTRMQTHALQQSQFGPPMPGTTGLVDPQPNRPVTQDPGAPGREPGSINDFGYSVRGDKYYPTKAKDITERTEDDIIQQVMWFARNQLLPMLAHEKGPIKPPAPPSEPAGEGKKWHWTGVYYKRIPQDASPYGWRFK